MPPCVENGAKGDLMLRLLTLGSLFLFALTSGCGNSVDHASAVKVMGSALTATVAADGQVASVDWNASGGHLDVALTNKAGSGSAQVTGTVVRNGSVTSTTLDVTLKDWTDPLNHVTLNGSLHEVGTFSAPLPLAGDVQLNGALAATGDVVATVDFDLHGTYAPTGFSVTGDVGGQSMSGGFQISAH
jgi:hypothetical protein